MLSARAPERNHEVLESPSLIIAHTGVHQRHHAGQKLMHALLLIEVVDHRGVPAGKRLEALLASGVRQTAPIKNKSPAVPALIFRQAAMEGETENPHHQIVCV